MSLLFFHVCEREKLPFLTNHCVKVKQDQRKIKNPKSSDPRICTMYQDPNILRSPERILLKKSIFGKYLKYQSFRQGISIVRPRLRKCIELKWIFFKTMLGCVCIDYKTHTIYSILLPWLHSFRVDGAPFGAVKRARTKSLCSSCVFFSRLV